MAILKRLVKYYNLAIVLLLVQLLCVSQAAAQDFRPTKEYQIKASLIFNFLQFIDWPPDAAGQLESDTIDICVGGVDLFGVALAAFEKEIVKGRRIRVRRLGAVSDENMRTCQVLFVSSNEQPNIQSALNTARQFSILTIGESQSFLDQGGVVALLVEGGRVSFDINRSAALESRLNISSKLLRVARQVRE